ncbi:MAG: hypothetical protein SFX18_19690 [Pirellulales bacterium]|nr:hypothetical protein [Pirellulales bacterium]
MSTVVDSPALRPPRLRRPFGRRAEIDPPVNTSNPYPWAARLRGYGRSGWASCERWARRSPASFSLTHVAILLGLVFAVFVPGFDTNDDAVMNMIASGKGIALAPDEHLVFTNVLIGRALKFCYQTLPHLPWYGMYLYGLHWLANSALLYAIISQRYTRLRMGIFWLYFATGGLYFLNNVQFTTTGYLIGAGGALLLLAAQREWGAVSPAHPAAGKFRAGNRLRPWILSLLAAGGLMMSGLVRLDAFFLVLALAAPVLLLAGLRQRRWLVTTAVTCAVLGLATLGVLAAERYHQWYYAQDAGWASFYQYNQLRVKFNDEGWVRYTPETEHVFQTVNWSQADFSMMMCWFYDDPVIYSKENLQKLLAAYPWQAERATWITVWEGIYEIFHHRTTQGLLLAWPLALFFVERRRMNFVVIAAAAGMAVALLCYLIVFRKTPPPRVFLPILAFPICVTLFYSHWRTRFYAQGKPRLWLWIRWGETHSTAKRGMSLQPYRVLANCLVGLVIVGLTVHVYTQYRRGRERIKERRLYQEVLTAMKADNQQERLFVCWSSCFPYEAMGPLSSQRELAGVRILALGWPQRTPFNERMKAHFGIRDLAREMCSRDDLLQVTQPICLQLLGPFIEEHYLHKIESVCHFNSARCIVARVVKEVPEWERESRLSPQQQESALDNSLSLLEQE